MNKSKEKEKEKHQKETCDSAFTLDDLIQESVEMNNFLKAKTNQSQPLDNSNYFENIKKFFSGSIKLRNSSKNNCWEKSNLQNNVSQQINLLI